MKHRIHLTTPFRPLITLCLILLFGHGSVIWCQTLVLGNPSNAVTDVSESDNYLLIHNGYVVSYSRSRGAPNWVTWHVSASDIGDIDRTIAFRADPALPIEWRIKKADYNGSGYDRGHMCPSEDHSDTEENNRETFLMSNMQPQLHRLNGGAWKALEGYVQNLVKQQGFEAYITAGCYGDRGTLNNKNKVVIPTDCWKIILLLPKGNNDIRRISTATRAITVNMPNNSSVSSPWQQYRTSVDAIETITGYDFLSPVPNRIEEIIESRIDDQ